MSAIRGRVVRFLSVTIGLIAFAYLGAMMTWERPIAVLPQISANPGNGNASIRTSAHVASRIHHGGITDKKSAAKSGNVRNINKKKVLNGAKEKLDISAKADSASTIKDNLGNQRQENTKPKGGKSPGEKAVQLTQTEVGHGSNGRDSDVIPPPLVGLIKNMAELKGRHSDYIMPPCQNNKSSPALAGLTNKKYDFLGPFPYLQNYKNPCWLPKGSAKIKCVPYFYLIGAPKAGSTDVFWRIKGHPYVTSGRAKEVRWFDRLRFASTYDHNAMPRFEDYLAFFERPTSLIQNAYYSTVNGTPYHHRILADGSPTYYFSSFNWPVMPGNEGCLEPRVTAMSHIHHLWPKAKIILVLRNPVTRLFSTYLYNTHLPNFNVSAGQFDKWVKQSMDVWYRCLGSASFRHCMYDRRVIYDESAISTFAAGIYSRYVLDLLKIFPREQIYFVHLETYSQNIRETLEKIYTFLNLPALSDTVMDKVSKTDEKRRNRGRNYAAVPEMWPSTRKLLDHFYAPYNAELSAILDRDPRWLWS